MKSANMKELVLFDSESADTVFCKPKYISNIQYVDNPLRINTNVGLMKSQQKCDIPYINDMGYK